MPQRVSVRDWPRLTRFYGIPPKDLARMPYALLTMYAEMLLELMAEETLEAMVVADMPYMKDSDRNRVRKQYTRWLGDDDGPEEASEPDPMDKEAVVPDGQRAKFNAEVAKRFGISVDPEIES